MEQYAEVVLDLAGNAVPGASVQVLIGSVNGGLATIYDASGTQQQNPILTGPRGNFAFQAANGKYVLRVLISGTPYAVVGPLTFYDPNDDTGRVTTDSVNAAVANAVPGAVASALPAALGGADGASKIGFAQGGMTTTTVETALRRNLHDVTLYFVAGEADAQPMFARALAAQTRVWVPAGTYGFNSSLEIPPNRTLYGEGGANSILSFNVAGDGLTNACPVNTSNAVNITLIDLDVRCTNPANAGGGFAQTCGSYVNLYRMIFRGWKYGTILDQTEHCHIREGQYHGNKKAGIWLVNGPTRTAGAANAFTNRISITGTQFNANEYGIINDGGVSHVFNDNNYNGGSVAIRVAGALSVSIDDNEIEYQTTAGVILTSVRESDGTGVGQCYAVTIESNFWITNQNTPAVQIVNGTNISLISNELQSKGGASTSYAVTGVTNVARLATRNNRVQANFVGFLDAVPALLNQNDDPTLGNRVSKTQFYAPTANSPSLEAYVPSAAGGGAALSGIDFSANNAGAAKVVYANLRTATYNNTAGTEVGALQVRVLVGGVPTIIGEYLAGGHKVYGGFGCNGKNPQAAYAVSAAATDAATTQTLVNQLRAALIANGICA